LRSLSARSSTVVPGKTDQRTEPPRHPIPRVAYLASHRHVPSRVLLAACGVMPVDRFWSSGRYAVAKPDTRHHSDGGVRTSGLKTLGLANRLFGQEVCDPRPWNSGGSARLLDGDHPYPARPKGVTAFRCCGQFPG